ncbi:sce7726 family protein [Chungangia koreensis]|uniref:Sce7726 family protein n=1 Tax=Chungangia koreensis TaxID=752657 RepID=A0ABV8X5U2_9LACT
MQNRLNLNRFFSKGLINQLLEENSDVRFDEIIGEVKRVYKYLGSAYRNEYYYKNSIFNKIVLGRYGLKTTKAFSEIAIGKSKADFVFLSKNRNIVYEIKTDLDNLDRLIYQIVDYSFVFSEIYVVTSEKNYYPVYKLLKEANSTAGIIVLTNRGTLSIRKHAILDDSKLKYEFLFKLLRKPEYEEILQLKFRQLPKVKPVCYYKTSLEWFKKIDIKEAQILVFNQLRKRQPHLEVDLIKSLPFEIRWLVYNGIYRNNELVKITSRIK